LTAVKKAVRGNSTIEKSKMDMKITIAGKNWWWWNNMREGFVRC
jgi:hypothetical protein